MKIVTPNEFIYPDIWAADSGINHDSKSDDPRQRADDEYPGRDSGW